MKKNYLKWLTSALVALPMLAAAEGTELPYKCEFNSGVFDSEWLVIDANDDGTKWNTAYSGINGSTAKYGYNSSNAADDWMMSPCFALEAGVNYQMTFLVATSSSFYAENLRVTMGGAQTVEAQTSVLGEYPDLKSTSAVEKTIEISVAESGEYYFGFQYYSEKDKMGIYIDDVTIEALLSYPAIVSDVEVTAGEAGALTATLSWTNPAVDQSGNVLEGDLEKVVIYRDGEEIATLTDMVKGEAATYTDATLTEVGVYTYQVVAYNSNGALAEGLVDVVSPWIGEGLPVPYNVDFSTQASLDLYTIIDTEDDGTWRFVETYSSSYVSLGDESPNDWLVTPPIQVEVGKNYQIIYNGYSESSYYGDPKVVEVMMGDEPTIESLTTQLCNVTVDEGSSSKPYVAQFTASESKYIYLALHAYDGDCDLKVESIKIETIESYPAVVSEVEVTAGEAGALTATLAWTNPAADQLGNDLEGDLEKVIVYRDGEEIATLTDMVKGEAATYTDATLTEAGEYSYQVVAYNSNGALTEGLVEVESPWIGIDTPLAPTDLVLTVVDDKLSLALTAPTIGVHDGWIDSETLSYTITRMPDEVVVEGYNAGFPYEVELAGLALYSFEVVAVSAAGESEVATSNTLLAGSALSVPYHADFKTQAPFDLYSVIDADGDGDTWKYSSYDKCVSLGMGESDDWLITPPVQIEAGKNYQVTFASSSRYNSPKSIKVMTGSDATIESLTTELLDTTITSGIASPCSAQFYARESKEMYVALHAYAGSGYTGLSLSYIKIEEIVALPKAVTDLAVAAADGGELAATLTWTNPMESETGSPIVLSGIEISRNDEAIDTVAAPALGEAMSYVDNTLETAGVYTYSVVALCDDARSEATTIETSWIGMDVPAAVSDLLLTKDTDGNAVVTYAAPTTGVNGGYIDFSTLTYTIVRYPDEAIVAEDYTELTFVDDTEKSLASYSYSVEAVLGGVKSEAVVSNALVFGGALALPYETNFATESDFGIWTVVDGNSDSKAFVYNSDCVSYTAYSAPDEWLISPPFKADQGTYKLDYAIRTYNGMREEEYEITYGTSADPADHTVIAEKAYANAYYNDFSEEFDIPSSGVWYVGIHLKSSDPWGFHINKAAISCLTVSGDMQAATSELGWSIDDNQLRLSAEASNLKIFSMTGALVANHNNLSTCNIASLPAGVYVVVAQVNGETCRWKIIK